MDLIEILRLNSRTVADTRIEEIDGHIIAGVIAYDDCCQNPLKDLDGLGEIIELDDRRRNREGLYELGLEEKGEPYFDEEIENTAEEKLIEILKKKAPDALIAHIVKCADEYGMTLDESIDEFVQSYKDGARRSLGLSGCADLPDWKTMLFDEWMREYRLGNVGDPFAVPLEARFRGYDKTFMVCHDPLEADAVWIPDRILEEELKKIRMERGPDVARETARSYAQDAVRLYNDWANGECYGVIVVTLRCSDGTGVNVLHEDSLWGVIGREDAEYRLSEMMGDARKCLDLRKAA
ncbi:hypothetical protein [Pelomicrobium methylotrophicum]|uniref:Uncharacterized protein n=1 Tax=Pelomicrobium methylotrophicum TaxID=2602750 RepID=A0A5C7EUC8_9PROT|nr:hypothetical protein [Pelomicrobium methylotrophicum]TXF11629.1 hypothetical protein FR698_09835 [Pelomicrobium methylotrophicum]